VSYSRRLLDAVEAALPASEGAGIAAAEVHGRVAGSWNRGTVRHALRLLVDGGRAEFTGIDRHRKYRRKGAASDPPAATDVPPPGEADDEPSRWRDYALRGDGSVRLPDEAAVAALMRERAIRYEDASAADLAHEERLAGWSHRRPTSADLTRAVFGDPRPGRNAARRSSPHPQQRRTP
jgi:hypothetical protein